LTCCSDDDGTEDEDDADDDASDSSKVKFVQSVKKKYNLLSNSLCITSERWRAYSDIKQK